ncbi:CgeB family protein [Oxalicibacterium faecigallinarum]|uniref:Spore protein YkvP/CgeB glycosyl transferase-like domain-containing protein n=1 Tax=Oxalicibacterium faecigallinarum TaxID=573741 RepID=A0A8J3ANE0_9BURK|nr:glycosyltransferase [Oxalicibacterium faecigallinarum]GGI17922.1 hypothetical protein GCM10008066_11410 [Oxalicibacterium faecigallinarum]
MLFRRLKYHLDLAKDQARRLSTLGRINSIIKARKLKKGLCQLHAHYAGLSADRAIVYDENSAWLEAQKRIETRWQGRTIHPQMPLRIFWVGANRDQDESGFLQALRQHAQVTEFYNHTGTYGQWYKDEHGRVQVYDPAIIQLNDQQLLSQLGSIRKNGGIDLLMGQMWANYISQEALAEVQAMGIPVINISMDDRLPDNWSHRSGVRLGAVGLAQHTDLVLTTSSETCAWYAVEGCPAIFWPLASDPSVFKPDADAPRDIDVLFIGNKYGIRAEIIDGLAQHGIQVECYGAGWPNGPATAEQSAALFKRARIILGVGTVGYCDDVFTLKLRDFDAPMSGALYLTHRSQDLLKLYQEGVEIECYMTPDEAAVKIHYYLAHPQALESVAAAGHAMVLKRDTWLNRLHHTFLNLTLTRENTYRLQDPIVTIPESNG